MVLRRKNVPGAGRRPCAPRSGGGGGAREARTAAEAAAARRRGYHAAVRLQAAWRCYECRRKFRWFGRPPPHVPDQWLATWRGFVRAGFHLPIDYLHEYVMERFAELVLDMRDQYEELGDYVSREEQGEAKRLLAAAGTWIEAMASVHHSPLTADLRRQGEIGEHLPRRARAERARRRPTHSCATPQHRAARPPIIHYCPVPLC